jgi:cellulose synthase/poly-beta-1,6-N-acetylglucosamine synthase-like glycosyltransferase
VLAIASVRPSKRTLNVPLTNQYAVAIPAHNEENIIGQTVAVLKKQEYPENRFDIFVVADFCADRTAEFARQQGAIVYERDTGERSGKGAALTYLFDQIFSLEKRYDAIVVFDAHTRVERNFLTVMTARLACGDEVVQGQHVISNPRAGWFPALSWSMMKIDNRVNNQGRENLNLSAKHMGDSICFCSEVIEKLGWGSGLTEDFELRLKLLLENIKIHYEPKAVGYGQAPLTMKDALSQRLRWVRGVSDSSQRYRKPLLEKGIKNRDWSKLDAVLSTVLPSYSTLSLISVALFVVHILFLPHLPSILPVLWGAITILCFSYPIFGLLLEKAPAWAYFALLFGPIFILWRTWLRVNIIATKRKVVWVRTPHQ